MKEIISPNPIDGPAITIASLLRLIPPDLQPEIRMRFARQCLPVFNLRTVQDPQTHQLKAIIENTKSGLVMYELLLEPSPEGEYIVNKIERSHYRQDKTTNELIVSSTTLLSDKDLNASTVPQNTPDFSNAASTATKLRAPTINLFRFILPGQSIPHKERPTSPQRNRR